MLHRLILTISLIALFGLAQIGALNHELSHFAEASEQDAQQNHSKNANPSSQSSHNHSCAKCLGYAGLGHAVTSSLVTFTLAACSSLPISSFFDSTVESNNHRAYSARAPPNLV